MEHGAGVGVIMEGLHGNLNYGSSLLQVCNGLEEWSLSIQFNGIFLASPSM